VARHIGVLTLTVAAALGGAAGCGGDDGEDLDVNPPVVQPADPPVVQPADPPVVPPIDDPPVEPVDPPVVPVEPESEQHEEPTEPTDPCAFPGDPLCPDTPVTVPPPDLSPW
jgi:hypothetical protein